MKPTDAHEQLWTVTYTSRINQSYYRILRDRWHAIDASVRGATFVLAILAAMVGAVGYVLSNNQMLGNVVMAVGIIATALAIAVQVFPIHTIYRHNEEHYQQFTQLHRNARKSISIYTHATIEGLSTPRRLSK